MESRSIVMRALLRALLVVLAVAAAIGLGIVFLGPGDAVTRVLLSVLVLGGAMLLVMPAVLAPAMWLRIGMAVLVGVDALLAWVMIWLPDPEEIPAGIGRASAMIITLLVVLAVGVVLQRVTTGSRMRAPRIVAIVSTCAGAVLLGMAWAMILTDGGADIPGRVMAGVAIIYAATALGALVLALLRSYALVRRT